MKYVALTLLLAVSVLISCTGSAAAFKNLDRSVDEAKQEWLFVQTAEKAEATSETTLVMLSGRDIFAFTDRPYRKYGYMTIEKFASLWDEDRTFEKVLPNAVLTWVSGEETKESEIIIKGAEWHSDGRVTYSFTVTAGDTLEDSMSRLSMFVDGWKSYSRHNW